MIIQSGEHAHDYTWYGNDSFTRSKPRELNDDEVKDNGDLLLGFLS